MKITLSVKYGEMKITLSVKYRLSSHDTEITIKESGKPDFNMVINNASTIKNDLEQALAIREKLTKE